MLVGEVPLDPDADEAADWLIRELTKPEYQAAQPTAFDRLAQAIGDWLSGLRVADLSGVPALGFLVTLAIVVAAVVVALIVFGLPRFNRRSAVNGALFGTDDARSGDQIRRDAEAAAAGGDYTLAVAEMFRAIARGLAERTLVTVSPGTTAHDFARRAGTVFTGTADRLASAAVDFDGVRYLDRVAGADEFARMAALEADLRRAKPAIAEVVAP